VGKRYGWSLAKQRVIGALLMLPLGGVLAVVAGAGHSGGMRLTLARLTNNVYTLWFVAALFAFAAGLRLLTRSVQQRDSRPPASRSS
jgi:hypothetical protein